jgi:hypothetical protein
MSIILNGVSYGVDYVNIPDDFREQAGAVLSVDLWGMDEITRRWMGRMDKAETERGKFKRIRDKKDLEYPNLYCTEYRVIWSAPFATLEATFKGVIDGTVPEPTLGDSGYRINTVELSVAADIGFTVLGNSSLITYYAPFAKVNFVSDKRRRFAQHANMVDLGQLQIIKQKGANLALLNIVKGASLNDPAAEPIQSIAGVVGRYNGTFEMNSTITSQKKVGQWWEGTETHEILIVPMEQRVRALSML